uniref:ApaG domain-containing protein n=1 Tax=Deinococcus sp. TaxID=47478 RepID=UPI0028699D24
MDRPTLPDNHGPDAAPDIQVVVEVQHLPVHSGPQRQLFTYVITLRNRSDQTWQLTARHWKIVDATGRVT